MDQQINADQHSFMKQVKHYLHEEDQFIECSVGIPVYNEETNIARTLEAVLDQSGPSIRLHEVIVVASGCTDRTVPIVSEMALKEPRIRLCVQEKREGKASAINLFLKQAASPVVVLIGADVIPEISAIEQLCSPFKDPAVGMVGGRPVPINDPNTFIGHAVHLLWRLHDRVARIHPKLGEVIAFRNVISGIPTDSAVDEISIQALITQLGYKLIYQPECIVYNKGPVTVRDFLKQRRRIYAGHLKVLKQQNYEASTMKVSPIFQQLIAYRHFTLSSPKKALWTVGAMALEGYARQQGRYDVWRKREHHIWYTVASKKDLKADQLKMRPICNEQSVIVFRLVLEGALHTDVNREREEHKAAEATRKLLPILRSKLGEEDMLSINDPGIVTAVIRADQHGAALVAEQIKQAVESTPVRVGARNREINVTVAYSSLTLESKQGITITSKSNNPSVIGIRAMQEALSEQDFSAIFPILTELHAKCWLIQNNRFDDLGLGTSANDIQPLIESKPDVAFPINLSLPEIRLDAGSKEIANALKIAIDGAKHVPLRSNKVILDSLAKESELILKEGGVQ